MFVCLSAHFTPKLYRIIDYVAVTNSSYHSSVVCYVEEVVLHITAMCMAYFQTDLVGGGQHRFQQPQVFKSDSREIAQGQSLISTGLCMYVRHSSKL